MTYTCSCYVVILVCYVLFVSAFPLEADDHKLRSHVLRIPKRASSFRPEQNGSGPDVAWDGWLYDAFQTTIQQLEFSPEYVSEECYVQTEKYRRSLANHTLWALKMFDASAKSLVGLLYANSYQMGHFDECVSLSAPRDDIRGKYCLVTLELRPFKTLYPKFYEPLTKVYVRPDVYNSVWSVLTETLDPRIKTRNILHWAICLPSSCSANDLHIFLNRRLNEAFIKQGAIASVTVQEKMCYSHSEKQTQLLGFYIFRGFMIFLTLLVSVATIVDMFLYTDKDTNNKPLGATVVCFSAYANMRRLFKDSSRKEFHIVNTLKFLCMMGVISAHQGIYAFGAAVYNGEDLENFIMAPLSILLFNGTLIVDTFFLSSGFITCYYFCLHLENKKNISILSIILNKLLRILPLYILVIAFYAFVLQYLGSGPLWNSRVLREVERCQKNWWTNILFINNYVNAEEHCVVQTWYLPCDMHFFIVGLFIIYISCKWKKIRYILLSTALMLSMVFPFYVTYTNRYKGVVRPLHRLFEDPVKDKHFRDAYIPSHMRAFPYIIGIILGFVHRSLVKRNYKFSVLEKCLLTITALTSTVAIVVSGRIYYIEERPYSQIESSVYAATHRIPWALGMGWLIIGDAFDALGPLFKIFRHNFFLPLGRLTYPAFLIHTIPQIYRLGSLRQAEYFTFYNSVWTLAANITLTYFFALILNLLFESPVEQMCKSLMRRTLETKTDSENISKISHAKSGKVIRNQSGTEYNNKNKLCI